MDRNGHRSICFMRLCLWVNWSTGGCEMNGTYDFCHKMERFIETSSCQLHFKICSPFGKFQVNLKCSCEQFRARVICLSLPYLLLKRVSSGLKGCFTIKDLV